MVKHYNPEMLESKQYELEEKLARVLALRVGKLTDDRDEAHVELHSLLGESRDRVMELTHEAVDNDLK